MEQVTKLSLGEVLQLEIEIGGEINPQTGEIISKGLLKEVLKFKTKYWLTKLFEDLGKEKSIIDKMREELIKEIGDVDEEGNYSIPLYLNTTLDKNGKVIGGDINPKAIEFQNKYNELLGEIKEIKHGKFILEDFESVESAEVYPVFFKLIFKD